MAHTRKHEEEERLRRERLLRERGRLGTEERGTAIPKPPKVPALEITEPINIRAPVGSKDFGKTQTRPRTAQELLDLPSGVTTTTPTPEQPQTAATNIPEEIRDEETGKLVGVTLPNGKTFFGSPEEIRALITKRVEESAVTPGAAPAGTAQREAEEQARLQESLSRLGQLGQLSAAEQADINFSQAATAGLASVIPGLVGGAALGFLGGGVGGALALGAAGGTGGFISGVLGNIKEQQRGELRAAKIEITDGRTAMRQLAMAASRDPANADVYITQFNEVLTRMYQARRQTQAETAGDLNAWMEDGREDLAQFDSMLRAGGLADIYQDKLRASLLSGTPLSINGEELFLDTEGA